MSTPNVPHRLELVFELPGAPEQVWKAIATGGGISSWFLPTDLDERLGGSIVTHMGEEAESPGMVTGWEPPHRFAYEEPDWAGLVGHAGADVTPLATEFLVEAQSGGTCVVRIVSSAFGTGADWEGEFFEMVERDWVPYFDRLRLYLSHYEGQHATTMTVQATLPGTVGSVRAAIRQALGIDAPGATIEVLGVTGRVEHIGEAHVLLHTSSPVAGFLGFAGFPSGDETSLGVVQGQFFSDGAAAYVEREKRAWQRWLESLAVPTS